MAKMHPDSKRFLHEMLTRIADKKKDGLLNSDEIQVALAQCGVVVDKDQLPFLKTALDSDRDGKVTVDEVVENMDAMMVHGIMGDELMAAFKVFDKDGNGFISRYELKQILTSPLEFRFDGAEAEELLNDLFDEYDANKDGKLSYTEFVRMFSDDSNSKKKLLEDIASTTQQKATK